MQAAKEGDTAAPQAEDDVDLHFVCFVAVDGALYELDGRKTAPINHGPSSPATLLSDTARVVQVGALLLLPLYGATNIDGHRCMSCDRNLCAWQMATSTSAWWRWGATRKPPASRKHTSRGYCLRCPLARAPQ